MTNIFRTDPTEGGRRGVAQDAIPSHHRIFSFFASEGKNFSGVLLEKNVTNAQK